MLLYQSLTAVMKYCAFIFAAAVLGLANGCTSRPKQARESTPAPASASSALLATSAAPRGLHVGAEPPNGAALLASRLMQLRGMAARQWYPPYDPSGLVLKPMYAIYEFRDLDKVAQGGGLESATYWSFAYGIESPDAIIDGGEVRIGEDGTSQVTGYGPPIGANYFAQVLQKVATLDQVRHGSYEVRSLSEPSWDFAAIWLKADDGGTDLIVPLGKGNRRFEAAAGLAKEKVYTAKEFLAAYRPYAQQVVERIAAQKLHQDIPSPPADGAALYENYLRNHYQGSAGVAEPSGVELLVD
jgi:hypothetical protein